MNRNRSTTTPTIAAIRALTPPGWEMRIGVNSEWTFIPKDPAYDKGGNGLPPDTVELDSVEEALAFALGLKSATDRLQRKVES